MSTTDAWMFPLIGSCVLFGLYLLFRFLSKEYVNMLLLAYFLIFSIGAIAGVVEYVSCLRACSDTTNTKRYYAPSRGHCLYVYSLACLLAHVRNSPVLNYLVAKPKETKAPRGKDASKTDASESSDSTTYRYKFEMIAPWNDGMRYNVRAICDL